MAWAMILSKSLTSVSAPTFSLPLKADIKRKITIRAHIRIKLALSLRPWVVGGSWRTLRWTHACKLHKETPWVRCEPTQKGQYVAMDTGGRPKLNPCGKPELFLWPKGQRNILWSTASKSVQCKGKRNVGVTSLEQKGGFSTVPQLNFDSSV